VVGGAGAGAGAAGGGDTLAPPLPLAADPVIGPEGSLVGAVPLRGALALPAVLALDELDLPGFACATTPARIPATAKLPTASHRRRRQSRLNAASRAAAGDAGASRRRPSMRRWWPQKLRAGSEKD
jgi:hypothetical protein